MLMQDLDSALRHLGEKYSKSDLQRAYAEISQSYRAKKAFKLKTPDQQMAYLQIRMPATIAVIEQVLRNLELYQEHVKTLLDLGTGPGSLLWAARNHLRHLQEATLVDQQKSLMNLGEHLLLHIKCPVQRQWLSSSLPDVEGNLLAANYDMVSASYLLNELSSQQQARLIDIAWAKAQHFIVLIEPGTPEGFINIQRARSQLIAQGAKILAPCTHENACPMTKDDWCHFSTRFQRPLLHRMMKGTLPYEDEKYSYLIAGKCDLESRPLSRIIKKPQKSHHLISLDVCSAKGLEQHKFAKSQGEVYKQVSKKRWGDVIDIT